MDSLKYKKFVSFICFTIFIFNKMFYFGIHSLMKYKYEFYKLNAKPINIMQCLLLHCISLTPLQYHVFILLSKTPAFPTVTSYSLISYPYLSKDTLED